MGAFWHDAQSIFETARQASRSGSEDCDLAILIGPQGGIQMLDASGWALPCLAAHHGARTAYRVTRAGGSVSLEGRCGSETCLLRSDSPREMGRRLLRDDPVAAAWRMPRALLATNPSGPESWTTWA